MSAELLEETHVVLNPTDEGDHDRFSHYARTKQITDAQVFGKPIIALCGKKWIPGRDPQKFPVCPTCKEIHDQLPKGKP